MKFQSTNGSKKISILHVSDLHRSKTQSVSNVALLHSLKQDFKRYSDSTGQKIDIAIVSGDIVQGVSPTESNAVDLLDIQYYEAEDFLGKLAEFFFDGNRERVILVPGNHDISWFHSASSMQPIVIKEIVDPNFERRELLKQLFNA